MSVLLEHARVGAAEPQLKIAYGTLVGLRAGHCQRPVANSATTKTPAS
jgi:hypothetical protein